MLIIVSNWFSLFFEHQLTKDCFCNWQ